MRKFVYVSEMLIVRHLGTPNSGFSGCHCMRDPVLYRSMVPVRFVPGLMATHPRSQALLAACVAISPGTNRTGTPQIVVFTGSKRATALD